MFALERALAGHPLAAGTGLAVAVLARPQSLLLIPVLLLAIAWRDGVRGVVKAAAPVTISILLTVAYNLARFGNPLEFGYRNEGFWMPFLGGAHMLLVDPTKSVLVFAPVTLLFPWAFIRLWHTDRLALFLIASTLIITFVVTALWHNPNGGWCWGPRLLLPGIPPAVAALGPWLDKPLNRNLAIALLVLGFAVSAPAVAISRRSSRWTYHGPPEVCGRRISAFRESAGNIITAASSTSRVTTPVGPTTR